MERRCKHTHTRTHFVGEHKTRGKWQSAQLAKAHFQNFDVVVNLNDCNICFVDLDAEIVGLCREPFGNHLLYISIEGVGKPPIALGKFFASSQSYDVSILD